MNGKRVEWIDVLKGLTIILVVWGHLLEHYNKSNMIYILIYSFHMPCFFIASGYVFNEKKYKMLKELIINKFKTLIWPIFSMGIVSTAIKVLIELMSGNVGIYTFESFTAKKILRTLLLLRGSAIFFFWFLSALFCAEILMYLQIKYLKKNYLILISSIIMCIIGYVLVHTFKVALPYDADLALCVNVFCILGYFYKKYEKKIIINGKIDIVYVCLFCILNWINWNFFGKHAASVLFCDVLNPLIFMFTSILGTLIMIIWSQKMCNNKILQYIGRNSLCIYCLQGILNNLVYFFIEEEILSNEILMTITTSLIAVIITLLLGKVGNFISIEMPWLLGKKRRKDI